MVCAAMKHEKNSITFTTYKMLIVLLEYLYCNTTLHIIIILQYYKCFEGQANFEGKYYPSKLCNALVTHTNNHEDLQWILHQPICPVNALCDQC